MKRRDFIIGIAAVIGTPVAAQTNAHVSALVVALQAQGYTRFRVSRTLLGRIRLTAISNIYRREIVMNRRTGEILRDFRELIGNNGASESGIFDPDDDDEHENRPNDDDGDDSGEHEDGDGDDEEGDGGDEEGEPDEEEAVEDSGEEGVPEEADG